MGLIQVASRRRYAAPPPGGGGGADPYPWFPALDLATVPFHVAGGAYGIQVPVQAPAPPTITSESNADNLTALTSALQVPGRRVTITGNIGPGQVNIAAATDVQVVLPNIYTLDQVVLGNTFPGNGPSTVWTRAHFTKPAGDPIGGLVRRFRIIGAAISDYVIDSLQIAGNSVGDPAIYPGADSGSPTRGAIVNNRIHAANAGYGYGGTHLVVAGNSLRHDGNNTDNEGDWGWRNGAGSASNGPYLYYRNDIRGERFAKVRFHPSASGSPFYAWVVDNTFVDRVENRSVDFTDTSASTGYPQIDAGWVLNNRIYVSGNGGMGMQRLNSAPTCAYFRANGNFVYGADNYIVSGGAPDADITGNTQTSVAGSDPAWGAFSSGNGDPTGIGIVF